METLHLKSYAKIILTDQSASKCFNLLILNMQMKKKIHKNWQENLWSCKHIRNYSMLINNIY